MNGLADPREEFTISARARLTVSACVVVTGLLVGSAGGGIASADTGTDTQSSGSTGQPAGGNDLSANTLSRAAMTAAQSLASTAKGFADSVGSLANARPRSISSPSPSLLPRPVSTFGGAPTVHGTIGAVADPASLDGTPLEGAPPNVVPDPTAITPEDAVVVPGLSAPPTNTTPASTAIPASNTVDPLAAATSSVITPAANVATALTNSVAAAPGMILSLPASATPLNDVLASLQGTLTSVTDAAAPLALVPSDLAALFNNLYGTTPVAGPTAGAGTNRAAMQPVVAPAVLPATSTMSQLMLPTAGSTAVPAPGDVAAAPLGGRRTPTTTYGATADAVPAPNGGATSGPLSTVEKVIGAFVASVSVLALLAIALPGVGGILVTWAAGIRIGYRQARAASALPSLGAARFVGSGPMGVVRSGSQVALGSRAAGAPRAATPEPAPTARVFSIASGERVA